MSFALLILWMWLVHDYMDLEESLVFQEDNYKAREKFLGFIRKEIVIVSLLLIIYFWSQ